jgi:hypothetical protein
MQAEQCPEYARLQQDVTAVLEQLTALTAAQLEAFRANDHATFMRLDRELENVVGLKERTIGALRQHAQEHGCKSPDQHINRFARGT